MVWEVRGDDYDHPDRDPTSRRNYGIVPVMEYCHNNTISFQIIEIDNFDNCLVYNCPFDTSESTPWWPNIPAPNVQIAAYHLLVISTCAIIATRRLITSRCISCQGQKLQVWGCLPRLYKVLYDTILAPVTYNTVSIITRISCRSVIVNIYSVQATDGNPINWSYLHDRGRPGPPFLCGLDHLPMSLVICIWITPIIAPKLRRSDERLNPNGDRAITMRVVNCEEGRSRAIGP